MVISTFSRLVTPTSGIAVATTSTITSVVISSAVGYYVY